MKSTIKIDGSLGEGGGQVLRSSLALSIITGRPIVLTKIRAGRKKPGLMRQHLTCVKAAAAISGATVTGAEIKSQALTFKPGAVTPGDYRFAVGTAGSAILVLQTILAPLLTASGPSTIRLEGGTHNPMAPPFEFLKFSFLPLIEKMGPQVSVELERPGYYPAGGGIITVTITPTETLAPIHVIERGEITEINLEAHVSQVPESIGIREIKAIEKKLDHPVDNREVITTNAIGPGNYVMAAIKTDTIHQVFSGFGERQMPAERIGATIGKAVNRFIDSNTPTDEYLADQLLLPLALAGAGSFRTTAISLHTKTNIEIIQKFLPITFNLTRNNRLDWLVEITPNN